MIVCKPHDLYCGREARPSEGEVPGGNVAAIVETPCGLMLQVVSAKSDMRVVGSGIGRTLAGAFK